MPMHTPVKSHQVSLFAGNKFYRLATQYYKVRKKDKSRETAKPHETTNCVNYKL